MKWCSGCKQWQPVSDFVRDRSRGDGLATQCRNSPVLRRAKERFYRKEREQRAAKNDPKNVATRERNGRWAGGRRITSHGYVLVLMPGHACANARGYVYEHRLVATEMMGRPPTTDEVVHHRNGDKTDNRPDNLTIISRKEHSRLHRAGQAHGHSLKDREGSDPSEWPEDLKVREFPEVGR